MPMACKNVPWGHLDHAQRERIQVQLPIGEKVEEFIETGEKKCNPQADSQGPPARIQPLIHNLFLFFRCAYPIESVAMKR